MTTGKREHLTWENFEKYFLDPEVPAKHPLPGTPKVEIFVTEDAGCLGLRIFEPHEPEKTQLPLQEIELRVRSAGSQYALEIFTEKSDLFRPFFSVLTELADEVQLKGVGARPAILDSVSRLGRLVSRKVQLSEEKVRGLIGELWVLDALIPAHGLAGVQGWIGHSGESHDFRIGSYDLEVKSTAGEKRVHLISGVSQLIPSGDRSLYLISIHLARAGASTGMTLPGMVNKVLGKLQQQVEARDHILGALANLGYRPTDAYLYASAYHLRSDPVAFEVVPGFPRITPETLAKAVGKSAYPRIDRVSYRISLEGFDPTMSASKLFAALDPESEGDIKA